MPTDYEFEERAAILEFDAGFSRKDAERKATEMRRKRPVPPPPNRPKRKDVAK